VLLLIIKDIKAQGRWKRVEERGKI